MDLNLARTLARVVEAESFTAAARSLGLPEFSVRREVARLEEQLGTRLLERTSGRVKLTTVGRAYYHCAARALAELAEAEQAVAESRGEARGLVRLTVPHELSRSFLSGVMMRFIAQYPAIHVDVSFSNRIADFVSEGFDLALTATRWPDSKVIARKVAQVSSWLVAAPAYLKTHPVLCSASDLKKHKCLVQNSLEEITQTWLLVGPRGLEPVGVKGAVCSDDGVFIHQLALRSLGIALLPAMVGMDDLRTGTLVRVLSEYEVPGPGLHLLLPSSSPPPRRVALFRDALIDAFAAQPAALVDV
jgi:DNA-binding transcriptional LysR family regulator